MTQTSLDQPAVNQSDASGQNELRELLGAVAQGDAVAFERLYRATSAKLFGICLRILPHRGDAEDVLQEVFSSVWKKAAQYDAVRASPITWLAMMARNRAIDKVRASVNERQAQPIEIALDVADTATSTVATAELSDEKRRLNACIDQLDIQRRNLIRVAFFEGATYEELALRTGSPLGTIKSWIRRGLAQLKTCLER